MDWVTEAKRPTTRANRIAEAVGLMAEGKRRNWKFEKK
ncbi:MAG: YdeI/OmpD-associated family protein [Pseudomonadota bacterium]|nr:YdeI/OmpD-associated family protein [Pseudomonadota bacterium]